MEALGRAQDDWTFLLGLRLRPVWDWAQGLYGPGILVPYNWDGAQGLYGPGISVPYNSPPLIHTRSSRRIKELSGPFDLRNLIAWDL